MEITRNRLSRNVVRLVISSLLGLVSVVALLALLQASSYASTSSVAHSNDATRTSPVHAYRRPYLAGSHAALASDQPAAAQDAVALDPSVNSATGLQEWVEPTHISPTLRNKPPMFPGDLERHDPYSHMAARQAAVSRQPAENGRTEDVSWPAASRRSNGDRERQSRQEMGFSSARPRLSVSRPRPADDRSPIESYGPPDQPTSGEEWRTRDTRTSSRPSDWSHRRGDEGSSDASSSSSRTATTCTVTSVADSGPGTLRECLENAVNGDEIRFDTTAFPPGAPATIYLENGLPGLDDGNVTIDGSDAGVILDGSNIGTTPEAILLDDVSLTVDGGGNLIDNGDFSDGEIHWRPWEDDPGVERDLNTSDFRSGPQSYEWSSVAHAESYTVYDTANRSDPFEDWPYDDDSTVWMPAEGGGTVEVSLWYRRGQIEVRLRALYPDGHEEWQGSEWFDWQDNWTQAVFSSTLEPDVVGVALELRYVHSERWTNGLSVESHGNTIRGLQIVNFPGPGIGVHGGAQSNVIGGDREVGAGPLGQGNLISGNGDQGIGLWDVGTSFNTIEGNYIGTDVSGTEASGNRYDGVHMNEASHNEVVDNLISGNHGAGVSFCCSTETSHNTVSGNFIGMNATGETALPNDWVGVSIRGGSNHILIGGDTPAERNVISGNDDHGIGIWDSDTVSNTISGNYIGVDASGTRALPNGNNGVSINDGASYNLIGGDVPDERNLIVANRGFGVEIWGAGTMSNTVQGNWIGLDLDEARQAFPADMAISPDYPNDCTLYVATISTGVHKSADCGDTWAEVNNGLTESRLMQVEIPPDATNANTVYALAENGHLFLTTDGGANWSLVSTTLEGIDRRNLVLSADFGNDQTMYASAVWWSWDELGDGPGVFKSEDGGVTWERVVNGMSDDHVWKVVASPDLAEKGTLFALTHSGIEKSTDGGANWSAIDVPDSEDLSDLALSPAYASDQTVFVTAYTGRVYSSTDGGGSWSGVDALRGDPRHLALSPDYPNDQTVCHGGGWNDRIYCSTDGGATWTETDTKLPGWLDDAATGIAFSPAYPTDPTMLIISVAGLARSESDHNGEWELLRGLRDLGNERGVSIGGGASHNTIGPDNVISNNHHGVTIEDDDTAYNVVAGNLIGTDPTGTIAQANSDDGVRVEGHHNLIGGGAARNVISASLIDGVRVSGEQTFANTVSGNYIGTDISGTDAIGNRGAGVSIHSSATLNVIGGEGAGEGNVISGNGYGVGIWDSGTMSNTVSGNYIGTDVSGLAAVGGNYWTGVTIHGGASFNLIGGDTPGARNIISGNDGRGVSISEPDTMSNTIAGNYIGLDDSGANALSNGEEGISIHNSANYNLIGGPTADERNVISANGADCDWCDGIFIGDDAHHNTVQGNYIGTDASGTFALGNRSQGVDLYDRASDNVIRDNLIADNGENGIAIWDESTRNLVEGNLIGVDAGETGALANHDNGVYIASGATLNTIGISNTIAFNGRHGVQVEGGDTLSNTITHNSIFRDDGAGISLAYGGNDELAAPRIADVDLAGGNVTGTACAGCTVEIYSADDEEGRIFEGETTADGAGNFAFNKGAALAGPNVTATATDAAGNTSPFSPLFEILWVDLGLDYTHRALDRLGLTYRWVAVGDFASVDLSDYDVLFVGSTDEPVPDDVFQPLVDRKSDIAAFVQAGGALVALSNGGDWGGDSTSLDWTWVPITITEDTTAVTRRTHIISPTHPTVEGVTDANLFYWWGAHGEPFTAWDWPEAASVVQASQAGRSALLAGPYGAGRMALTGMFPDRDSDGDRLLKALLTWAAGQTVDMPPQVARAYPEPDGWAATNTRLRLVFDQLMDHATVTDGVLTVVADSGPVAGTLTFLPDISQVFFTPDAPLTPGEMVTVTLATTVTDLNGNPLDGNGDGTAGDPYTWTFTVRAGETLTVSSADNDGPGTLREALEDALPGDTITFDPAVFPPDSPTTIALDWDLPDMTAGYVTVDASNAGVVIDNANAGWAALRVRSDGNVLQGLTIVNSPNTGLWIGNGAAYNLIGGDRTLGSGPNGQGNTIGNNGDWGIMVQHTTPYNTFLGNYVGTDPSGTLAWPNGQNWGASGLFIEQGSDYTVIGSDVPGERNLLSGNDGDGLDINESYSVTVLNNYLGTDASGTAALPNRDCGLDLQGGSRYSRFEGNIFSGNWCGAQTDDPGTGYNEFVDNYFGVDATGDGTVPNWLGLYVFDHVEHSLIENNLFANTHYGVFAYGIDNVYRDNYIGTDPTESADWGHEYNGLTIYGAQSEGWTEDSFNNLVEDNVVAHNGLGIVVYDWGGARVDGNTLRRNRIYDSRGTSWAGPTLDDGIALFGNANANLVPPIVTSSNPAVGEASGTACANCTIEVFSDNDDEGRWYEGTTTAGGAGDWSFSKGSAFTGANVHATATDAAGNTSEFSGPAPVISSVTPDEATPGTHDLGVTISGDYFRDNEPLTVDFGSGVTVASTEFLSPSEIKVHLDVDAGAAEGPRDVTVTNYDGQSATLPDGFEIVPIPPPPPVITAVSPDEIAPNVSGNLTVHGEGFIDRPAVDISGDGVTVNWVRFENDTRLTVNVSVESGATLSARDVTVTNPDGQSDMLAGALSIVTPYFTDVASSLGLDFSSGEHGAAWGDLDGDGWLDLAIGDGSVYTNTSGSFSDVTDDAGLDSAWYGGVAWGDYNNDGKSDLLHSWRKIYRQSSLPFTKVLDGGGESAPLAWLDYDLDGDLDAYASGRLYRNDGGDSFTDVTDSAGIAVDGELEWLASVSADYDDDGDPDLYITCNGCQNRLFRNNGDGTFTDVTTTAGVGHTGSSHGAAWGDYDNDGDFDLFVANHHWEYSTLYRNSGDGTFQDVSAAAGLHDESGLATGVNWLDYNLDGWLDIFVVNRDAENRLYRNNGDGTFTDYRLAAGVADDRDSEGSTVGDYDNDGDPDIYVVSGIWDTGTPNFLFRNNADPGAGGPHWLKVELVGVVSNRSGIGAEVRVYGGGLMQTRQLAGSTGYMSQDAMEALFGLGNYNGSLVVEVSWPSGATQTLTDVAPDQAVSITEPSVNEHDFAVIAINQPKAQAAEGTTVTPQVTVRNLGSRTETNVPVQLVIEKDGSQVYNQTTAVTSLAPAVSTMLSFPAFTYGAPGQYRFTFTSQLPGDQNTGNDELQRLVEVSAVWVDIWTKDNPEDNGDVPTTDWWQSPDIWVRRENDGVPIHQDPVEGVENYVYVRVRNRGNTTATDITVDAYWHGPAVGIICGDWNFIGSATVPSLAPGATAVVVIPWTPTRSGHTCLYDVIENDEDPVTFECDVPGDNNIEQRNVEILRGPVSAAGLLSTASPLSVDTAEFQIANIFPRSADVDLNVKRGDFPLSGSMVLKLDADLFDRWWAATGGLVDGGESDSVSRVITLTDAVSATVRGLPMYAEEKTTAMLELSSDEAADFTVDVTELINGQPVGGSVYTGHTCQAEDLNCDNSVDIKDVQEAANAWRAVVGDPGYDVWIDLNQDGKIDVSDIMEIVAAWAP